MKSRILLIIFILTVITVSSYAQVIRPFTVRYNNPSVRGNIVYVANSIISTNGSTGTGEVPPGGTSTDNTGAGINIDIDNVNTTILSYNSSWAYLESVVTKPSGWQTVGYTPAFGPWQNGNGYFGWTGPGTCLKSGCAVSLCTAPSGSCSTRDSIYLFRKIISFNPSLYTTIQLNVKRNDGIIIYINGTEQARNNITGNNQYADGSIAPGAAENVTFTLNPSFFVNGNNTIAVEIHSDKVKAADIGFDMEMIGVNTAGTFNSSSADLNLVSCSQVLFAGLYWGADQGTSGSNTAWMTGAETTIKLKLPGASSYTSVTSQQTDYHSVAQSVGLNHTGYLCFKNITSLINVNSANGTYTVADVLGPIGITNACGGWTIVIAYSNPTYIPRNLSVFDGSVIVNGGDPPVDIPISGFLTPPSGTVSCELGAVVYDGDRVSTDSFSFKQNGAGSYYPLATTTVPLVNNNDFWNSVISYKSSVVTTRNPAYNNTLGYDSKIIDLPNASNAQLGNNQNSATVRFSSPSENYFVHVLTTSISQFNPSFAFSKASTDLNGGSLVSGDIIRYRLDYQNVGNDISTNTIITDNLPVATGFVPGSLKINGVTKTDGTGDDQAEYDYVNRRVIYRLGTGANAASGGTTAVNSTGYVEFDVYTTLSCEILACGTPTNNIARINYAGLTSTATLYDSSGYINAGCLTQGPISNVITGTCFVPGDTILVNQCPSAAVTLPYAKYAGYSFFTAQPFITANAFNPSTAITQSGTYWAYFNSSGSCHDTIRIRVYINPCPDIDDDDDGLPDYLEMNNPVAFQDLDGDGILNYSDATYPGFVDYNSDGINDLFDPGADLDNDGTPNFIDPQFPGYMDSNGDSVNDNFDWDLDGIPNHLDRDSDNDGIPDVVESFGVDTDGDGKIDNYSDTDNDGLSQNVDGNNTGAVSSGIALGALDTDNDGIPNYFDLDSDNDGIPGVIEAFGTDSNNDGIADNYIDMDGDGFNDGVDGDAGNDGVIENAAATLLRTGTDGNNDGHADSWSYKNMDGDIKPNPYDLDSDGDGIADVREAQFTDADLNGRVDGSVNAKGWNTGIAAMGSLSIPNSDAIGRVNVYDIDSDDDGIPDNVEGMATLAYLLPSGSDTDGDGIDNSYDNIVGFGGKGITPYDLDGDTIPDYLDSDTDSDGLLDRVEGNDFNLNGSPDDNVTLTGLDTDGDGLDNRFDNNNASAEATSAYMGNGGSTSGDITPGSITTVQHTAIASGLGCTTQRDWRCIWYVLNCDIINFKAALQSQQVILDWKAICRQEIDRFIVERSTDRINFTDVLTVTGRRIINETESYQVIDNITGITTDIVYYRLRTVAVSGKISLSQTIAVGRNDAPGIIVQILPNPVRAQLQLQVKTNKASVADIYIMDINGRTLYKSKESLVRGNNTLSYNQTQNMPSGAYYLRLNAGDVIITRKFNVAK